MPKKVSRCNLSQKNEQEADWNASNVVLSLNDQTTLREFIASFFGSVNFPSQGCSGIGHAGDLKKVTKTGERFTAISVPQNYEERVSFGLGIGNSVKSLQRKFIVPRYLKIFLYQGTRILLLFCEQLLKI